MCNAIIREWTDRCVRDGKLIWRWRGQKERAGSRKRLRYLNDMELDMLKTCPGFGDCPINDY